MKATNEQNRKQKDNLDKLEARMGLYEGNSYKKNSRKTLQGGHGFNQQSKKHGVTASNHNVPMPEAHGDELPSDSGVVGVY